MAEEPEWGIRHDALGIHAHRQVGGWGARPGHGHRSNASDPRPSLPCAISARRSSPYTGPSIGSTSPTSISRFTQMTRQATAYRDGRYLFARDASPRAPEDPISRRGPPTPVCRTQ